MLRLSQDSVATERKRDSVFNQSCGIFVKIGPNGEWGCSTRCPMLGPERPEAVLPARALHLTTFSHLFIVNKLLSLSLGFSVT